MTTSEASDVPVGISHACLSNEPSTYLRKFAYGAREDRSLTRAAQQRLPSRDREGVVSELTQLGTRVIVAAQKSFQKVPHRSLLYRSKLLSVASLTSTIGTGT